MNISFIIPTYNCERYIRKTIESIHNDNLIKGDEIIVIDDNSSDGTTEILKSLINIKMIDELILSKYNRGEGVSKNIAINKSKNSYFFCLDHDNLLKKGSISQLRKFMGTYDVISFGECEYFEYFKKNVTHKHIYQETLNLIEFENSTVNPGFSGNLLYKKSAWLKVGGFENVVLESWNIMYKMLLSEKTVKVVTGSSYLHRYGHESAYTSARRKYTDAELINKAFPAKINNNLKMNKTSEFIRYNHIRYHISRFARKIRIFLKGK